MGQARRGALPVIQLREDCTVSAQELAGTVGQRSGKKLSSPLEGPSPSHFLTNWTSAVWPRSGCSDSQAGEGEERGGSGDASAESVGPSSEPKLAWSLGQTLGRWVAHKLPLSSKTALTIKPRAKYLREFCFVCLEAGSSIAQAGPQTYH